MQAEENPPIPGVVWKLGWISFFADVASEMAYPLLPLFLRAVLLAQASAIGAIEGVAESIVSIMKGWSGWQSDRRGKRVPFVRWGYFLSALGKPLVGLATVWPMVLFARSLDRVGKGLRTTARDALLVDAVDRRILGRAFGLHRGMDTAGALVGVLLSAALIAVLPGQYRLIFLLAGIPGLASVWLTMQLREEIEVRRIEPSFTDPMPSVPMPTRYWVALSLTILFSLANSSDAFLILRTGKEQWGYSPAVTVLAYALYNVSYMLLSYPAGVVSDRLGRWGVIALGWTIYALVYAGFGLLGPSSVWILFGLYGVTMGLTKGVGTALVADYAPPHARGTALGLFYMISGLATLVASLLMGVMWDRFGPRTAFLTEAGIAAAAVMLVPIALWMSKDR